MRLFVGFSSGIYNQKRNQQSWVGYVDRWGPIHANNATDMVAGLQESSFPGHKKSPASTKASFMHIHLSSALFCKKSASQLRMTVPYAVMSWRLLQRRSLTAAHRVVSICTIAISKIGAGNVKGSKSILLVRASTVTRPSSPQVPRLPSPTDLWSNHTCPSSTKPKCQVFARSDAHASAATW